MDPRRPEFGNQGPASGYLDGLRDPLRFASQSDHAAPSAGTGQLGSQRVRPNRFHESLKGGAANSD